MDPRRFITGSLAYVVPTFALGFVWHLVLFAGYYQALQIYRPEPIIPFGFTSMLLQGGVFSYMYGRLWPGSPVWSGAWQFAAMAALLSWTFTTLAVAAKHPMTSVGDYLVIETAFTVIQFAMVAPLMALAWRRAPVSAAHLAGQRV